MVVKKKKITKKKSNTGRKSQKLTIKQKRFCELFASSGNALQSAIKAGYSKKSAGVLADETLKKPYVNDYLQSLLKKQEDKRFATLEEVQAFWSNVLRKEEDDITLKDRLKASEFIAKTKGAFIDKVEHSGNIPINISVNISEKSKHIQKR